MKAAFCLVVAGSLVCGRAGRAGDLPPTSLPPDSTAAWPWAVRWGGVLSLNRAHLNFNRGWPRPSAPIATRWQYGFGGGLFLRVAAGPKISLQQEYLFEQVSGKVLSTNTTYTLRYLSLPLLLRYQFTPALSVLVGAQPELLLQAQQQTAGARTTITHDTEERSLGAVGGLELRLGRRAGVGARYMAGLNHIGIGQRSAVQEFKTELLQLNASVLLR